MFRKKWVVIARNTSGTIITGNSFWMRPNAETETKFRCLIDGLDWKVVRIFRGYIVDDDGRIIQKYYKR